MTTQTAFVFAKPHANTEKVRALIKKTFEEKGIKIVKEGDVDGPTIDKKQFIDQHYYAIAEKATIKKPTELNIKKDKFLETFGKEWDEAKDNAYNALDACEKLGVDGAALDKMWAKAKSKGRLVKMGGGFYCGQVMPEDADGNELTDKAIYTFNAFFMEMRGKFTAAGTSIHYYVVEFDPKVLAWASFRGEVLGPTDPAAAPATSLRGMIAKDWEALGLAAACNTGDNAVHASASPFEGLAERTNWLRDSTSIEDDVFGKVLIENGLSAETIKAWSVDPQVTLPDDSKGSIFDALEDKDIQDCIDICIAVNKKN